MVKFNLEEPQNLALSLLSVLPSTRTQDILKKRYGILDDNPKTLEAIGKTYHITRERVRQIIEAALKSLKQSSQINSLVPFWSQAKIALDAKGGIEEEQDFLKFLKQELELTQSTLSTLKFLLLLDPTFILEEENEKTVSYWHLQNVSIKEIEKTIKTIEEYFKQTKTVATLPEILTWIKKNLNKNFTAQSLEIYLKIIKSIGKNPFGEYGLRQWSKIEPSGVKDRAYLLMLHQKQPMHFREIAKYLNENKEIVDSPLVLSRSWFKKAEVQTIHNELIKDPRFVLIGRGIYALKDWGYKPGKVADVIKEILKEAKKPLTQEEIIKEVQKRRVAKTNTIILNLHNNKLFKKVDNKHYTLATSYKILEG